MEKFLKFAYPRQLEAHEKKKNWVSGRDSINPHFLEKARLKQKLSVNSILRNNRTTMDSELDKPLNDILGDQFF